MIGSISITESKILQGSELMFSDVLVAGSKSAWSPMSYSHEIRSLGGYWKAEFKILPNHYGLEYLEEYLRFGLGRHVESFLPDGRIAWEGHITRMKLSLPGAEVEVSMRDMANKVWVRYLTADGGLLKRSTVATDANSQATFGVREEILQGGIINSSGKADQAAEAYKNEYADPRRARISVRQNAQGGGTTDLTVYCSGYFRTLDWITYNQTSTRTDQNANAQIQDIVDVAGQFVNETSLATNTIQISQVYDMDVRSGDAILGICRMGDASNNRWIAGMYEPRILRYEQARDVGSDPDNIRFGLRVRDNRQMLIDPATGHPLNPAEIRPNNYLWILDLFGSTLPKEVSRARDPQLAYIESVIFNEPAGLTMASNRASQADVVLAKLNFGGASQL